MDLAAAAAAVEAAGATERVLASLLAGDGWQVALLATLALVTKTYSDFADSEATNAVLCAHRSGLRAGWPLCTGARLRKAEHDLLALLDFRTTVSATELFKVGPRCGWGTSDTVWRRRRADSSEGRAAPL